MEKKMRKIQREMAVYMGITLSFCLSLFGNATSGNFSPVGWILNFILSSVISLIIGWFVPMKTVSDKITNKIGIKEGTALKRVTDSFISDIIYTPVITLAMIILAYKQTTAHGGHMPFVPVFIKALIESLVLGLIIIHLLTPVFLKYVLKKNGIPQGGPPQGMPPQGKDN